MFIAIISIIRQIVLSVLLLLLLLVVVVVVVVEVFLCFNNNHYRTTLVLLSLLLLALTALGVCGGVVPADRQMAQHSSATSYIMSILLAVIRKNSKLLLT